MQYCHLPPGGDRSHHLSIHPFSKPLIICTQGCWNLYQHLMPYALKHSERSSRWSHQVLKYDLSAYLYEKEYTKKYKQKFKHNCRPSILRILKGIVITTNCNSKVVLKLKCLEVTVFLVLHTSPLLPTNVN